MGRSAREHFVRDCARGEQPPAENEFVTAAEIRQRDREERTYTPVIRVIEEDETTHEQCVEAGIDDALVKSLAAADLKATLERHITRTAPIADEELFGFYAR